MRRITTVLGTDPSPSDEAVDRIAARMRRDVEQGTPPARAIARACAQALDVLVDDACVTSAELLPDVVARSGRGHELACMLVAQEAARRAAIDARLVLSPDSAGLVVVDDAPFPQVVVPTLGEVAWVPMPAGAVLDDSWGWCCAHDATRALLRLLEPTLDDRDVPAALALLDLVTA